MTGDDFLLLVAYLTAAATVWLAAGLFNDMWRNRKRNK